MNLREFNALKVGDQVENAMTNGKGTVCEVAEIRTGRAVSVKWSDGNITFPYATQSTAWMHWSKVEDIAAEQAEDASKRAT